MSGSPRRPVDVTITPDGRKAVTGAAESIGLALTNFAHAMLDSRRHPVWFDPRTQRLHGSRPQ